MFYFFPKDHFCTQPQKENQNDPSLTKDRAKKEQKKKRTTQKESRIFLMKEFIFHIGDFESS